MSRQIVHHGRKIRVAIDVIAGPDGEEVRRDVVLHPGAVVILPIIDRDHICLLKNYRFVVNETLWEVPAGTLEPNEDLESAARRELQEETGFTAKAMTYRGYYYASPGVLDEKLHLFFAGGLTPGVANPEPGEELEPVTVKLNDAVEMIIRGEIKDAKTVTAILLWGREGKS